MVFRLNGAVIQIMGLSLLVLSYNNCSKVGFSTDQSRVQTTECWGSSSSDAGIVNNPDCLVNGGGGLDNSNDGTDRDGDGVTDPNLPPDVANAVTVDKSQAFTVKPSASKVDIMLVIDNSLSMTLDLTKLRDKLDGFVDFLSTQSIDWQMCLTTNDPGDDGQAMMWSNTSGYIVNKSTPNLRNVFLDTIGGIGPQAQGDEQGIRAVRRAVESNTRNCFRDDAALAAIIISDEDERSVGQDPALKDDFQWVAFTDYNYPKNLVSVVRTKWPTKPFIANTIIINPGDSACFNSQNNEGYRAVYGKVYDQLRQLTGGAKGNICAADYASQLKNIGVRIKSSLSAIQLECAPFNRPVVVLNPSPANTTVELQGDRLIFNPPLPEGTTGTVAYKCQVN